MHIFSHHKATIIRVFFAFAICPLPWKTQAELRDGEAESPAVPLTYRVPEGTEFRRVRAGAIEETTAGGTQEKLIYDNTHSTYTINLPTNLPVSDDISIIASNGCNLKRYRFKVMGKVLPSGATGPYTVTYGLYSNCPLASGSTNAARDVVKIPGTDGVISFDDDAPRVIEHVVDQQSPVALPTNFYLSLRFNRGNCGTVVGAPPTLGFSDDSWDFPGFPCKGSLGGFPAFPHASMWAEFFGDDSCSEAQLGYRSARASGGVALIGANIQGVDDISLATPNCQMTSYEVAVKGVGFYTFDLRTQCEGSVIPGTERTFQVNAMTQPLLQLARFDFDPPITIPSQLWLGFRCTSNSAGSIVAGIQPVIGQSGDDYFTVGPGGCNPVLPISGVYGAIHASITCQGTPPSGACCDIYRPGPNGEVICRDLPELNCPNAPSGHWIEGAACADNPFPHPCGQGACCVTDHGCEDMTQVECNAREPVAYQRTWSPASTCQDLICEAGDCLAVHGFPACANSYCRNSVCSLDAWCCDIEWDSVCVAQAVDCQSEPRNHVCGSQSFPPPDGAMEIQSNSTSIVSSLAGNPQSSLWYRFTATEESAQISTCGSPFPTNVDFLGLSVAADNSSLEQQCATLSTLSYISGGPYCPEGRNNYFCISNLTPGQEYFVNVGIPSDLVDRGLVHLTITSPCPAQDSVHSYSDSAPLSSRAEASATVNAVHDGGRFPQSEIPAPHESPSPSKAPLPMHGHAHSGPYVRGGFASVQVNVDALGNNIVGDAGNEPSIAVDPKNPLRMAIGWRQFDNPQTDRRAGYAYSQDGGSTWHFPGVLDPDVFRSDPVLESNSEGVFFYHSIRLDSFTATVFRSFDGGATWDSGFEFGGDDKPWIAIDKTTGPGRGNLYSLSTFTDFQRGRPPNYVPFDHSNFGHVIYRGTMDVDAYGAVWIAVDSSTVLMSSDAYRNHSIMHSQMITPFGSVAGPNPNGLSGQAWIGTNPVSSPNRQSVYLLNGQNMRFTRSLDRGATWEAPIFVHDDPATNHSHWFGMMGVAPSGRIDAVWNDTRNSSVGNSELFYSYSEDGGATWSANVAVSPSFDSTVGWPGKLGDYYDMVSDGKGAHVAYAATFNGEHDVYYLRLLPPVDCNKNGVYDLDDISTGTSLDTNHDDVPDECQSDFDGDGLIDDADPDIDGDGVLNSSDVCMFTPPGEPASASGAARADTDGNCAIDLNDYWRLQNCMAGGFPGLPAPAQACLTAFDRNADGHVDLYDLARMQNTFGEN